MRLPPGSRSLHKAAAAWPQHQMADRACPAQILAVVQPQRDRMDACLVFPSMPAVMRLNKLGTFSMAQLGQSKVG